jgi:hypothetical protein
MSSENEKEREERLLLMRFLDRARLPIHRESVEKLKGNNMPDFSCYDTEGKQVAFELTIPHSDGLGKLIGDSVKRGTVEAIWTNAEDIKRLLRQKLGKGYNTDLPIDLVLSRTNGVIDTDEQMRENLATVIDNAERNPFQRIWYDGEDDVYCFFGDEA